MKVVASAEEGGRRRLSYRLGSRELWRGPENGQGRVFDTVHSKFPEAGSEEKKNSRASGKVKTFSERLDEFSLTIDANRGILERLEDKTRVADSFLGPI